MGDRWDSTTMHPSEDGTLTIKHSALEDGLHELNLSLDGENLEDIPLRLYVSNTDDDEVISAYGPGLYNGIACEKQIFYVYAKCPDDDIRLVIDGPSPAEIQKKYRKAGLTRIEYIAFCPGEYAIIILYKDCPVEGSPFRTKISGEGKKKSYISIEESSNFDLGISASDMTNLSATIKMPDSTSEAAMLQALENGNFGLACFQPKLAGTYTVNIGTSGKKKIEKSPFVFQLQKDDLCDALQVSVQGATSAANSNEWISIGLDCSKAGYGIICISIEGTHSTDFRDSFDGRKHKIDYRPHEPGFYHLFILYGGDNVPGSPFVLEVSGNPSGKLRTLVSKQIQCSEIVHVNQKTTLSFSLPETNALDMETGLTSPSGSTELCEIRDMQKGEYVIKFQPNEPGINVISIKEKEQHIKGSPCQYTVGKQPTGGYYKVDFGGTGITRGVVDKKTTFNVYTREAGAGLLSVAIDGPSKATLSLNDTGTGFVIVTYTVSKPGEYWIGVKYEDLHVPGSPCKVSIDPPCPDAKRVIVHALRDRGAEVNKTVTFHVSLNGAEGELTSSYRNPAGKEEIVKMEQIDSNIHGMRFLPTENGMYYVSVRMNSAHVPGSPFAVLVGKLGAEPALVVASGTGLEKGEVGKRSKFDVQTLNSGTGPLEILIEGPARTIIACEELDYGYDFTYTPKSPGIYFVNVKFCHVPVAGSPFKVTVKGRLIGRLANVQEVSKYFLEAEEKSGFNKSRKFQGDPLKVVVMGVGLKKGFLGKSCAFTIDLKEAGHGLLHVSMISPNGYPTRDITLKKQRMGVIQGSYTADERGEHFLNVKWGEHHVPGSPFQIPVS